MFVTGDTSALPEKSREIEMIQIRRQNSKDRSITRQFQFLKDFSLLRCCDCLKYLTSRNESFNARTFYKQLIFRVNARIV